MHFAMPPRKTSRPPPYAARNSSSIPIPPALRNLLRRLTPRTVVLGIVGFLTVFWLLGRIGGGEKGLVKPVIGTGAPVVIVTVFDPQADEGWKNKIRKNREDYARKHGELPFCNVFLNHSLPMSLELDLSWT
jgi:mannan polymerase II complex MNN11 subunit